MSLLPHSSDTESIVGIRFGIFSPEDIRRRGVCEITSAVTTEGKAGGLFDARMGVLENGKICRSCGQNNHHCPGHFGYFELARPLYNTQFFKIVLKVLSCVCYKCAKLLVDTTRHEDLLKLKGEARWKKVYEVCSKIKRCGEDTEDGCGSRQPAKYSEETIHRIIAEFRGLEVLSGVAKPEGMDDSGNLKMPLEPEYVYRLLRRITDEDVEFMGFSRHYSRPDWMMCKVLPIPPPQVRPSVTQDNNQRSEDDLTSQLACIIKTNGILKKKINDNEPKKRAIDEWTNLLQYYVATLVDNNIPGVSPSAQRSGRQLKSLQQRLGSKEGRIRSNLQGKRVEFSARSVITPDPNISVKELGIPEKIATNLTFPEMVTAFNIGRLYKLVQNGPDVYPGAKTIQRANGRTVSLKHVDTKKLELFEGDVVHRHLMDGDPVLFNRQPSLHRMSMMCHIAKILPYNTFRLNVFVTAPYNADFDGDEMNLHAPQSIEAATELRMIAAVPLQIVSPRESTPIVSVVQDTLVGANRFARPNVFFTRKEAMNLLVHAKRWDGRLPAPAKTDPKPMWSGQQLMSALLPPVSLQMNNKSQEKISIFEGVITAESVGFLDKDVFSKQLLHIIYNDYGPEVTIDFLDSLQKMIAAFLTNDGFSVGIGDLIADEATLAEINVKIDALTKSVEDMILQLHTGLFENTSGRSNSEEFESKIMATLNKAVGEAGGVGLKSLAATNRMTNMIKAGSKGSDVNVSQMVATLGQTAIEGKRVPNGFQHRTLPHNKRFDDSAVARGFIKSSYIKGLQPDEFFFHAMSGREGLIDTAVKTADTGYMQRQIRVALEDLITQHDGSVRDAIGNVLQISYGEDGINATKLENQPLPLHTLTDDQIAQEYEAVGVPAEQQAQYLQAATEDRRIVVERLFLRKPQNNVRYPVHLSRMIHSVKQSFRFAEGPGSVAPADVLAAQATILQRTHAKNRLWGALVRYHLRPRELIRLGYTKVALEALAEQIVLRHWQSWVEPGQPVGVIAAQSIGEPATQMTLNSVDFTTEIVIAKDGKIITPQIGEFIDHYLKTCEESRIQRLPNDQLYVALDDGHEWSAVSCDENGTMMWTKLEAITKHPVVNEDGTDTILEVTTESGRTVKATKGKSFLTVQDGKLLHTNGSDLKVGDELPIANTLAIHELGLVTELDLSTILPKTEWLYGDEAAKALAAMNAADEAGQRHWFQHANGKDFTVPYSRSDGFRDAFAKGHNTRAATFLPGFVYPKSTRSCTSQIPSTIPLTRAFGFFAGAYLSEGSSSPTQIQITNNDDAFLVPIRDLLDSWSVGHHTVSVDKVIESTGIKGRSTSLVIHSTLLTKVMKDQFGAISYGKTMPTWVLQAPDAFVEGLMDGYMSGDGCVTLRNTVTCSSVSEALITRLGALLVRYGIHSTVSSNVPPLGRFASVSKQHTLYIPVSFAKVFANRFHLTISAKQERLEALKSREPRAYEKSFMKDVILDRVKTIRETHPTGGRVYDLTVEKTRNFTLLNAMVQRDTFHLAGVAAKSNMTRGVPRLKELLKATKNPKAIELTIPLRRDLRTKKEEARRVAQDLEFTMLQDIVTVARIYYDPRDSETLLKEDAEWLAYLGAFEDATKAETKSSPWILRFELDRERMFAKNITMDDVAFLIKRFGELTTLYTDYNATRLVVRARLEKPDETPIDDLNTLKALQNKILSQTAVRGIPGLRSVTYQKVEDQVEFNAEARKYEKVSQYVLISDGSNFLDVIAHPDVDGTQVVSSNVHDMFECLGIEATRATFYKELTTLFAEAGSSVNYRHVCILLDMMCHKGRTMSIDRYGINKNNIGPLAKMSFEQTEDIALRAAIFGEHDPCLGVSAKVMLGAPIKAGTAFSELLLDEEASFELSKATPAQHVRPRAGPAAAFEGDEEEVAITGDCAIDNLRIRVGIPNAPIMTIEEEDMGEEEGAVTIRDK